MRRWVARTLGVSTAILDALRTMAALFLFAVVLRIGIEYAVNEIRSTDHWVVYHEVAPLTDEFPVGQSPIFLTKSDWKTEITASWPDVMWCKPLAGPREGITVRFNSKDRKEVKKPGKVGFYDEKGILEPDSKPGYWQWDGDVPDYPADCWMESNPTIYPSPLVERSVPVKPTGPFKFR